MASFKTEELAIRLGPFNEVVNHGYRLAIYCTEISALNPKDCSGTYPIKELTGPGLDKQENLRKLKEALEEALAYVASRIEQRDDEKTAR